MSLELAIQANTETLNNLIETIKSKFPTDITETNAEALKAPKQKKLKQIKEEDFTASASLADADQNIPLDQIREIVSLLCKKPGGSIKVSNTLKDAGFARIPDIPEDQYANVHAELTKQYQAYL